MTLLPRARHRASSMGFVVMTGIATWSRSAAAEDTTAEARYREGRRAAQAEDWDRACRLFRESLDLEPAPGTLLNLADCEEHVGSFLAARAHFDAAARGFRPGDKRADYAKERLVSIAGRIPKLTVRLAPGMPPDTVIERDGLVLDRGSFGVAASVDPGEHTLVVKLPGRVDAPTKIRLVAGQAREVELSAEPGPAKPRAPVEPRVASPPPPPPAEDRSESRSGLRVGSYVAFGAGVVGLAVGTIGGILTIGAKSDADDNCHATCNAAGMDAQDRGKTWSTVSTVGFIAGGVGIASGIGLLLLSSKDSTVSAQPVAGGAAVRWAARF